MKLTIATIFCALTSMSASATVITPGECAGNLWCIPGPMTNFSTTGIFGQRILGDTNIEPFATSTFTGNLREIRLIDGMTGGLDFLFQVQRTGGVDPVLALSTSSFAGAITNVGYCAACSPVGDFLPSLNNDAHIAPNRISRSQDGASLVFDFGAGIRNSDESFVMVVKTDALQSFGGQSLIGDASVYSFGPTKPVPEPAILVLLGMSLVGLFFLRRRSL